jgi:hypothetical protein
MEVVMKSIWSTGEPNEKQKEQQVGKESTTSRCRAKYDQPAVFAAPLTRLGDDQIDPGGCIVDWASTCRAVLVQVLGLAELA